MRKPLTVSDYGLSDEENQALLEKVGLPTPLIKPAFDMFARRTPRANTWSRARGIAPGRRVDVFELFSGLALTCRGILKDKLALLFSLFDLSGDGVLGEGDLGALISSCASVLRHLGLSLPITVDDAAYVAGGAIFENVWRTAAAARENGSVGGDEPDNDICELADEVLNLPLFLRWAQRAEFPVHTLEVLALPLRVSRAIDQATAKIILLRERYATVYVDYKMPDTHKAQTLRTKDLHKRLNSSLDADLVVMGVQECPASATPPPLSLPPMLSWIGPHGARVALEIGEGGVATSVGSAWYAVAVVEERQGSRYSLVDTQPVVLVHENPAVFRLWGLRSETDHRFRLSWCARERGSPTELGRWAHDQSCMRTCGVIRFRTLRADARIARQACAAPSEVAGVGEPARRRRHIEMLSAYNEKNLNSDRFGASCITETAEVEEEHWEESEGEVAVIIAHRRVTSLEAPVDHIGEPWSASASLERDANGTGVKIDTRIETWRPEGTSSELSPPPKRLAGTPKPGMTAAPFCGDGVATASTVSTADAQPWGGTARVVSGEVDIILHLSPDWRAPEAIRRSFVILKECSSRKTTAFMGEDGKGSVLREVTVAVRALLSRTCSCIQHQQGSGDGGTARNSAHKIMGWIDPWLGLDEV